MVVYCQNSIMHLNMVYQKFIMFSILYRAYTLPTGTGFSIECLPSRQLDCLDYRQMGHTQSGVYLIIPPEMQRGYDVYCDMTTDGGGWTVFQRRVDGSENFNRKWTDYELDFGDIEGEHWLGFIPLSRIMSRGFYELRIDLEGLKNDTKYAAYKEFSIDFANNYKLRVMGYNGTAGDSMVKSNGMMFTTSDEDNDNYHLNCAELRKGPWWYDDCAYANLNGQYYVNGDTQRDGMFWQTWYGGLHRNYTNVRKTEMKIRRL